MARHLGVEDVALIDELIRKLESSAGDLQNIAEHMSSVVEGAEDFFEGDPYVTLSESWFASFAHIGTFLKEVPEATHYLRVVRDKISDI